MQTHSDKLRGLFIILKLLKLIFKLLLLLLALALAVNTSNSLASGFGFGFGISLLAFSSVQSRLELSRRQVVDGAVGALREITVCIAESALWRETRGRVPTCRSRCSSSASMAFSNLAAFWRGNNTK